MYNLFHKKRQKIIILPGSMLFIFLFFIASFIISILTITITTTTLANHAYAEFASTGKDSPSVNKSFDSNPVGIINENHTQINNQDNSSDKMKEMKSIANNTIVSKHQGKNETNFSFNITNSIDGTSSFTNTAAAAKASEVTADFNGDGFSDIAIGVPTEDVPTADEIITDAGAVNVIYGTSNGLNATALSLGNGSDNQIWTEDSDFVPGGIPRDNDRFGSALATGSFNNDGFSDLTIGKPGDDAGVFTDTGQVIVIYGSSGGLDHPNIPNDSWSQDSRDIEDRRAVNDRFGSALATDDFNNDGFSDLAIGVPGESIIVNMNILGDAGTVNVIYGSSDGLKATELSPGNGRNDQIYNQLGVGPGTGGAEFGDLVGSALATGDFNKDGFSDLVIGVPGEDVGIIRDAGEINILFGSSNGLHIISGGHFWHQNIQGIEDDAEISDIFGSALETGDFNKDGISDLAIGVPDENIGTITGGGAVNVIYGSIGIHINSGGLSTTVSLGGFGRADQIWTQDSSQIQDNAEAHDGFGQSLG